MLGVIAVGPLQVSVDDSPLAVELRFAGLEMESPGRVVGRAAPRATRISGQSDTRGVGVIDHRPSVAEGEDVRAFAGDDLARCEQWLSTHGPIPKFRTRCKRDGAGVRVADASFFVSRDCEPPFFCTWVPEHMRITPVG